MYKLITPALFLAVSAVVAAAPSAWGQDSAEDTSLSAQGDAEKGQRVFNRCKACHNLTTASRTRLGPNLNDLFGRPAGKEEGYKYSRALAEADFVWTEQNLANWLEKPNAFLPGNKMAFAGVRKEQERKDLIAYLRRATVAENE